MLKAVRVIRTYRVEVEAEYGDTEESLIAKATVTDATPFIESAVLLPDDPALDDDTPILENDEPEV